VSLSFLRLLDGEQNAGMRLAENFAMYPASSVSRIYLAHPEARYFAVGRVERDQVLDYAARKGMEVPVMERWLSPNLNYDPDEGSNGGGDIGSAAIKEPLPSSANGTAANGTVNSNDVAGLSKKLTTNEPSG
jgi:Vitamin B12 dependent methionine synthase, activation domain